MATQAGKGAALRSGFAAATGDIIVALDADCSMHPREIVLLVSALMSGADFVKGSRFIQGGGTADMSLVRMVGNWGLAKAVRALFGGSFSDLCYSYLAFWAKHGSLLEPRCDGFEVETFLNVQALKAGLRILEVSSFEARRMHGESHLHSPMDARSENHCSRMIRRTHAPGAEAPLAARENAKLSQATGGSAAIRPWTTRSCCGS